MDNEKLEKWAQKLLDTSKRNNMINFKASKTLGAEVVYPDGETFFNKCISKSTFEIYNPLVEDLDTDDETEIVAGLVEDNTNDAVNNDKLGKNEYIALYSHKINQDNQILVYSQSLNPIDTIKRIHKKSKESLEETGNNFAHMAFGFIHWKEQEDSTVVNKAPLLLVPITFKNDSVVDPYFIELTDEEVIVNPTFSYYLNAQYELTLPEYEEDESLTSYIEKVQEKVSKLHWQVTSECQIGIFAFTKINMYLDFINNEKKILRNENVRLLLGEARDFLSFSDDFERKSDINGIIDLHTVVDADSSQIEAIEMAKSGQSFVLQGPPGTGKSQTITNIIAECLYDGKKVLFVSEKLVALNVVYEKLKQAGLEEFCLELHSHKSNKKKVIDNLYKTLITEKSSVSPKAEEEIWEKENLQKRLDKYAEELHKPIPGINKSMYQLYEAYSAQRDAPELDFLLEHIVDKDEEYLKSASELLCKYEEYIPTIGYDYRKNVWYGYNKHMLSYEEQSKFKQKLQKTFEDLKGLIDEIDDIESKYCFNITHWTDVEEVVSIFNIFSEAVFIRPSMIIVDKLDLLLNTLNNMAKLSERIIPLRDSINEVFEESIYKLDGQDYYNKIIRLYSGFFSRLFSADYKRIIADIRLTSKTGMKLGYSKVQTYMKSLMDYQNLIEQFDEEKNKISDVLKIKVLNVDTDYTKFCEELKIVKGFLDKKTNSGNILSMSDEEFDLEKTTFGKHANSLTKSVNLAKDNLNKLQNDFDTDYVAFDSMSIRTLFSKIQQYRDCYGTLGNWNSFSELLEQLDEKGLLKYIIVAIENEVDSKKIVSTYKKLFYNQWINHMICEKPVIRAFTRIEQDRVVKRFKDKDKLQFEISKAQIKAELSSKRPDFDMIAGGSEVEILKREGQKKSRQKNIRKLLGEAGNIIQTIKPCFLMSPLSVSTLLGDNDIEFDTVVFDEASQIFPQDAIGAIYRGKQIIVVGDSKQMPPSDFFKNNGETNTDEEDDNDISSYESILDMCKSLFPQIQLKWHYRSKYEQLISFSNKYFYDNALITFPSSKIDHEGIGVDYYHVNGFYDRNSRTNRAEADFIVDLIYKNIEKYPERSIGVVAFNEKQMDLIERLLDKRRKDDSSKEWYFKDTEKEAFFVKNLDAVQGDERDTIIFSVVYGRDSQGKLLYNFGPLNKLGGERRLNVAVTRAKENVQLVSIMSANDIDLKRTGAEGTRLLREYLDYAEHGEIALDRSISVNSFDQFDSEFEMEVCDYLRDHGFTVDTQVGCSGFRIDLALKKPDSSEYVLAIECDGATYHSSKNARDRDRLRQEILENMGWKFYRIWSTDWFRNNQIEKENLLKACVQAINSEKNANNEYCEDGKSKEEEDNVTTFTQTIFKEKLSFPIYQDADVDELYYTHSTTQSFVKAIMEKEAPVSEEYLLKQICFKYGQEKVSSAFKRQFNTEMRGCERMGIRRQNGFLYLIEQKEFELRIPGHKRDIKYISAEELAAGLITVLKQNYSADRDGLYKTVANQLGFSRMGKTISAKLDEALALLDNIVIEGNTVSLK